MTAAGATIDRTEVEALLSALVRVPSVTGSEGPIGRMLAGLLEEAGMDVELQPVDGDRCNVIGRVAGTAGPSLLLCGHMDVVPPGEGWTTDPFTPVVADGLLRGRGSADMKGGVAAIIAAVRAWSRSGPHGDLLVSFLVGEEEDLEGAHAAVAAGLRADMAIITEPTELEVVTAHKGATVFRIVVRGRSAHASTPEMGTNAIEAAARVIGAIAAMRDRVPRHPRLGRGTVNVGTIHGGTRPYVVPDEVTIEVDRRIVPGETLDTVVAETEEVLAGLRDGLPGVGLELIPMVEALPLATDPGHLVVEAVRRAVAGAGLAVREAIWPAVSDASVLSNHGGIPTVLFGPGSIRHAAHQADEWVPVDEVRAVARVLQDVLETWPGSARA